MNTKIKPFLINNRAFDLTNRDVRELLQMCLSAGALGQLNWFPNNQEQPDDFCGVQEDGYVFSWSEETWKTNKYLGEISPKDVPTWLSHGMTLAAYKESEPALGGLDAMQPTNSLMPHDIWIQLRQYEIVKALARQVEANAELNCEWVEELNTIVNSGKVEL